MTRVISVSIESWSEFSIKDICINISSGGTPSRKVPEYYLNGVHKWIKTQELKDCNIYDTDEHITDAALKNSSAKIYPKNTISMAMYGATVGKLGIMKSECATNQACCNMVVDSTKADYRFLFYSLLYRREELIGLASGAAQQNLNVGVISNFRINLPTLSEQKVIAATLSVLDDMIELNNKINKTLEEMAQAIFKSWFVDFEPFRDGEFEESELGLIPKGWRVGCVGDYVRVKSGFAFKSSWWEDKGIPVIKIKNIDNYTIDFGDVSYVSEDKVGLAKEFIVNGGDLVIAMTGATIGKFAIVPKMQSFALVNQRVGKFFLGDNPVEKLGFIYCILKQDNVYNEIVSRGDGSAQPNISPSGIESIKIVLPPQGLINEYNQLVTNMFNMIIENFAENSLLICLRDILLPKLMSGEIRVPVEDVV